MQKIIYLENYKNYRKGDIEFVSNNIAHGLIELGIIRLYNNKAKTKIYKSSINKMMIPDKIETIKKRVLRRDRKQKYQVK